MRRHPNYVYRPKRRSHGTTKNLLTKSCAVLPTTTGPSMPPSSFEQRYHFIYLFYLFFFFSCNLFLLICYTSWYENMIPNIIIIPVEFVEFRR